MSETIFVTGSTGLLGSHLLHKFVLQGHRVRALRRATSSMLLVEDIASEVEWVEGDVLDIPSLEAAMDGVTQIYHCAAIVSFNPAQRDRMIKTNLTGTANIVNFAVDYGVQKLVHVSSIAALGRTHNGEVVDEQSEWTDEAAHSNYALSKFLAEREVWRGIAEGLDAVIVNPSVILGAGNGKTDSSKIYTAIAKGIPFYPLGTTGFVGVEDVAEVMVRLMESDISAERFIVNTDNWSFKTLFSMIARETGKQPPSIPLYAFLGELGWRMDTLRSRLTGKPPVLTKEMTRQSRKHFYFDNRKIRQALGYTFSPLKTIIPRHLQMLGLKANGP